LISKIIRILESFELQIGLQRNLTIKTKDSPYQHFIQVSLKEEFSNSMLADKLA